MLKGYHDDSVEVGAAVVTSVKPKPEIEEAEVESECLSDTGVRLNNYATLEEQSWPFVSP